MDLLVPDATWARPQNKWTTEQRLFLCCMVRYFKRDKQAFAKIFSTSFEAEIRQSGYYADIPWDTLHSQWDTMKRSGDYLWGAVHLSPFRQGGGYGTWQPYIHRIQLIAWRLNIQLIEKSEDDTNTSNYQAQPPKDLGLPENVAPTVSQLKIIYLLLD